MQLHVTPWGGGAFGVVEIPAPPGYLNTARLGTTRGSKIEITNREHTL